MNDLFSSKKAIAVRLGFLVVACIISGAITRLMGLPNHWSFLNGVVSGVLSQHLAMAFLMRH